MEKRAEWRKGIYQKSLPCHATCNIIYHYFSKMSMKYPMDDMISKKDTRFWKITNPWLITENFLINRHYCKAQKFCHAWNYKKNLFHQQKSWCFLATVDRSCYNFCYLKPKIFITHIHIERALWKQSQQNDASKMTQIEEVKPNVFLLKLQNVVYKMSACALHRLHRNILFMICVLFCYWKIFEKFLHSKNIFSRELHKEAQEILSILSLSDGKLLQIEFYCCDVQREENLKFLSWKIYRKLQALKKTVLILFPWVIIYVSIDWWLLVLLG